MIKQRGFTLVELAVVLVIIGLLVGGVMVGQSMIRTTELRTIITDYQKYSTAIKTFKQQYGGLPGDMPDATDFWANTSNGDNTGDYNFYYREPYLFWQHLALAKLIDGYYAASTPDGYTLPPLGVDIPKGKVTGTGWSVYSLSYTAHNFIGYYTDLGNVYRNYLTLGTVRGSNYQGLFLTPAEMSGIDSKIDDGKPATGYVIAGQNVYTSIGFGVDRCTTSNNSVTATYQITNTYTQCAPAFAFPK